MPSLLTNKAYFLIAMNLRLAPVERLLENTNLQPDKPEDMALEDVLQITRNMQKYSHAPHFAALFGRHLGAASHGPVGYATLSAPTVGKALSTFVEWFHIRAAVYAATITELDNAFVIQISDTTGDPVFKAFFFEAFMRAFEIIITHIMGQVPRHQTTLWFETKAEDRSALMHEEYSSKLYFGQQKNQLFVPKDIWFCPSPLYDKASYEFNIQQCQK